MLIIELNSNGILKKYPSWFIISPEAIISDKICNFLNILHETDLQYKSDWRLPVVACTYFCYTYVKIQPKKLKKPKKL